MLGWTITGVIFFIKPGYKGAYDQLVVKTYPISQVLTISSDYEWQEVRLIKTVLGQHLLVKKEDKLVHLDAKSLAEVPMPDKAQLTLLLEDAFTKNPSRYGRVLTVDNDTITTSTGVEVILNWKTLTLRQKGNDSRLINLFYKIHYLQWTPNKEFNQVLGIFGLFLLLTLTVFGIRIYIKGRD